MTAGNVCPRCGDDLVRVLKVEHEISLTTQNDVDQRDDIGTSSRFVLKCECGFTADIEPDDPADDDEYWEELAAGLEDDDGES